MLGGMLTAFLLANAIALAFDPLIFQHYREMLRQEGIQNEFIPTLSGGMIRGLFFRRFFWVRLVPMGLGLPWSARYYWKHQQVWDWPKHGPWLLVVAGLTTPYSWIKARLLCSLRFCRACYGSTERS
jgi:hypothetical protein